MSVAGTPVPTASVSTAPAVMTTGAVEMSMNWEPVRKRLLGADLSDGLKAAAEIRQNIEIVHSTAFPLMLSALLPAFSSVLATRTRPTPDTTSVEHKFRNTILDIISKMPSNDTLRPHAPHLVAVAIDVLNRDYEENALLASRIIFDLYKVYRSLPQDYVQPYIDFVINAYRSLPVAIQRCFTLPAAPIATSPEAIQAKPPTDVPATTELQETTPVVQPQVPASQGEAEAMSAPPTGSSTTPKASGTASVDSAESSSASSPPTNNTTNPPRLSVRSNISFRVLTECPLMVMLMFQLYPKYVNGNIPVLISVMMEGLALRAPSQVLGSHKKIDANLRRLYFMRTRELVAAQAKTLSFLTYLLRSFSSELRAYEDRLANNVVALMTICPREAISTRKELLVATRHLLNSDFRNGFFRHADALLDERVLMGSYHSFSDQALLRPLGYTTLSDLVQHVRSKLTMPQMARVVGIFSRVLHDSSTTLPMSTQYIAVRTLLSVVDIIFHNKDPNPQIGRDMLVRTLAAMMNKLTSLCQSFPTVGSVLSAGHETDERAEAVDRTDGAGTTNSVRDIQSMIRAMVVGHKTIIYYIHNYRNHRDKDKDHRPTIPAGSNEEVSSAMLKLTSTEVDIINRYIKTAFQAIKILNCHGPGAKPIIGQEDTSAGSEKTMVEQHRDALTYFASAFVTLDGFNLRRTLGTQLNLLFDAIVDDPTVMVVPRHLLASNATTSVEFCSILLEFLLENMELMSFPRAMDIIFVNPPCVDSKESAKDNLRDQVNRISQLPEEDDKILQKKSAAFLQLFERVLKSLSTFKENETVVRRHLRRIVPVCLQASMENTASWPDSYCMLLRYAFRSISAGKFEESYKELLPMIPAVLNGLYRVVVVSKDSPALLHTAIELCLTIPARLSSLLPHMNLLLRIIVPALDSSSGDLVNLGYVPWSASAVLRRLLAHHVTFLSQSSYAGVLGGQPQSSLPLP
jgi:transformation/transcription domain-associated protein